MAKCGNTTICFNAGTLPDEPQTVPRSEIQAVLDFLRHTNGSTVIYIDCKPVLNRLLEMQTGWQPDAKTLNGDLYALVQERLRNRTGSITYVKVKAHLTLEESPCSWAYSRSMGTQQ